MRRNLTISFDADFIDRMDAARGELSRGVWIEQLIEGDDETRMMLRREIDPPETKILDVGIEAKGAPNTYARAVAQPKGEG